MAEHVGNGLGWLFTPDLSKELNLEDEESFFKSPLVFKAILESIQDGVSIIDTALNIRYMNNTMRHIYFNEENALGKKCFTVYHGRNAPCAGCPSLKTFETKTPCVNVMEYDHGENQRDFHQLFSIPVLNRNSEVILVVEYIRDITAQNNIADSMQKLTRQAETLEHRNQVLMDILNLYPAAKKRDSLFSALTPRELQIALLIKDGAASKEIAGELCITQKAVDFHRLNIRKKLELKHGTNLRIFLGTRM
ncbi:MAG: helix-turn-helix transcriptional regulator [Treponema sp.]|jgi:DNA-binding NarL/FixJ family response regulator|nr:helix-turn-helix transcriptional regulator [Treponema sp.]